MTYQMLLLYTAPDNFTAEMLMAALRENNIPAVKRDLGSAGLANPYQGNSFEGDELFVEPEGFQPGKALLPGVGLADAAEKGPSGKRLPSPQRRVSHPTKTPPG